MGTGVDRNRCRVTSSAAHVPYNLLYLWVFHQCPIVCGCICGRIGIIDRLHSSANCVAQLPPRLGCFASDTNVVVRLTLIGGLWQMLLGLQGPR